MIRVGAFVCTFRRTATLLETLRDLLSQTRPPYHVLVIDNDASTTTEAAVRTFGDQRLAYLAMQENVGPPGAVAMGLAHLRDQGFDWILWGDDDDPPKTPNTLERQLGLIEAEDAPDLAGVAAVGARWDWRRGESRRLADEELTGPIEVDIAGGGQHLLVRSCVLGEDRLPDARLFFALADFDFCLRLRRAGYRFMVDGHLMSAYGRLFGRVGLGTRPRSLPGGRRTGLWRRYYSTRNYVYLMRRRFSRSDLAWRGAAKAVVQCAASWALGPGYGWHFTRSQLAAVRDGFSGRLGRTVEPVGYPPVGSQA